MGRTTAMTGWFFACLGIVLLGVSTSLFADGGGSSGPLAGNCNDTDSQICNPDGWPSRQCFWNRNTQACRKNGDIGAVDVCSVATNPTQCSGCQCLKLQGQNVCVCKLP